MSHVKGNLLERLAKLVDRLIMKTSSVSKALRDLVTEEEKEKKKEEKTRDLLRWIVNLPELWYVIERLIVRTAYGIAKSISSFQRSIEKSFALASLLAGVLTVVSLMVLVIVSVS